MFRPIVSSEGMGTVGHPLARRAATVSARPHAKPVIRSQTLSIKIRSRRQAVSATLTFTHPSPALPYSPNPLAGKRDPASCLMIGTGRNETKRFVVFVVRAPPPPPPHKSVATGAATLASGVNYLLVSGLKPRGRLGKRLMVQRENLQERYREREVLVRERMGVGRERMRARQVGGAVPLRLAAACCLLFCNRDSAAERVPPCMKRDRMSK